MKQVFAIILLLLLCFSLSAQKKECYTQNGTTYYKDSVYKSTGLPVVKRSTKAKQAFLIGKGFKKCPKDRK